MEGIRRRIYWGEDASGESTSRDYVNKLKISEAATALGRLRYLADAGAILNHDICAVHDGGILMLKFRRHCLGGYIDDDGDVVLLAGYPHRQRGLSPRREHLEHLRDACAAHRQLHRGTTDDH